MPTSIQGCTRVDPSRPRRNPARPSHQPNPGRTRPGPIIRPTCPARTRLGQQSGEFGPVSNLITSSWEEFWQIIRVPLQGPQSTIRQLNYRLHKKSNQSRHYNSFLYLDEARPFKLYVYEVGQDFEKGKGERDGRVLKKYIYIYIHHLTESSRVESSFGPSQAELGLIRTRPKLSFRLKKMARPDPNSILGRAESSELTGIAQFVYGPTSSYSPSTSQWLMVGALWAPHDVCVSSMSSIYFTSSFYGMR